MLVSADACRPTGPRRRRDVRSNRELVSDQFLHSFLMHYQHYQIYLLIADLQPNAPPLNSQERRRRPLPVGLTAHNNAFAIAATDARPPFFSPGTIATHDDLSSRSPGMPLSGVRMISLKTSVARAQPLHFVASAFSSERPPALSRKTNNTKRKDVSMDLIRMTSVSMVVGNSIASASKSTGVGQKW
jgi:hypothetical protein